MTESGASIAIWNEYTLSNFGGGDYGGYPLHALDHDTDGLIDSSNWDTPFPINAGCLSTLCDPGDFWEGNSRVINTWDGPKLIGSYDSWDIDDENVYMITSSIYNEGYGFQINDPYILFDGNEADPGDCNTDSIQNILDIVYMINECILGDTTDCSCGDLNEDGTVNVLDVVLLVNTILEV